VIPRWRPAPLIRRSVLWHAAGAIALVALPSSAAGRAEFCLTFDDGPDPQVTPQVLDLLDRLAARGLKSVSLPAACNDASTAALHS
jgi:peptidoglycan/xylan/chitin deacetylase (PgdA/CDA1 family)